MNLSGETISLEIILSGTGTSHGIPVVGCHCSVCKSDNPKNRRLRSGVIVKTPSGNIQIDTSPDLRQQLLVTQTEMIDAVLFTHSHADHIYGLDDLRICCYRLNHPLPLYGEAAVETRLKEAFSYAFNTSPGNTLDVPRLEFRQIDTRPFVLWGIRITPIRLMHGMLPILGYRLGDFAFCTDVSAIPEESMGLLEGLEILVLDALRYRPHGTHLSIDQACSVIERLQPKQAYLTHLCHDVDHEVLSQQLPGNIQPAWDGLSFRVNVISSGV